MGEGHLRGGISSLPGHAKFRCIESIYRKSRLPQSGSVLELAILGLLKGQDLHGYELRRRLGEILGPIARLSFGTLYPALNRLEKNGAVRVVKVTESRTGLTTTRGRKVYAITEHGEEAFSELLSLSSTNEDDKAFAFRLAFARYLSTEARVRLLTRRREQLMTRLDEVRRSLSARMEHMDAYGRSLIEHSTEVMENDIAWLDRLVAREQQGPTTDAVAGVLTTETATSASHLPKERK